MNTYFSNISVRYSEINDKDFGKIVILIVILKSQCIHFNEFFFVLFYCIYYVRDQMDGDKNEKGMVFFPKLLIRRFKLLVEEQI